MKIKDAALAASHHSKHMGDDALLKHSLKHKLSALNQNFSQLLFAYVRRQWLLLLIIALLAYLLVNAHTERQLILERDYPNEQVKQMLFPQEIIEQQYLNNLELKDTSIENAETITKDNIPHLFGTLINHNEFQVYSVIVEVAFFWDKTDPATKFDTRYVNISTLGGGEAYTFKENVGWLNIPDDKPYDFTSRVVAATQ